MVSHSAERRCNREKLSADYAAPKSFRGEITQISSGVKQHREVKENVPATKDLFLLGVVSELNA